MSTLSLPNLSLIAAVVSCLIQVGAQLFAVVVVVATVTEAPPRSLAILAGGCSLSHPTPRYRPVREAQYIFTLIGWGIDSAIDRVDVKLSMRVG